MNNLLHLKYAVEVEKTGSISKAAENLYMGQPHLSKAIRDLEESLGIAVFNRTSKGVIPTERGAEFLEHAKDVLRKMEEIESLYSSRERHKQAFDITVPRASYVAHAFCNFVKALDQKKQISINYRETNAADSIQYVAQSVHDLAIIRYQLPYEQYFLNALAENDLRHELLLEFDHVAIMSKNDPLAKKESLVLSDLSDYIEVAHGDISVPDLPSVQARKIAKKQKEQKRINVYERGSQFQLLSQVPNTFMWVSPVPNQFLDYYNLVQIPCESNLHRCKDLLISRKSYHFTEEDKLFVSTLKETIERLKKSEVYR